MSVRKSLCDSPVEGVTSWQGRQDTRIPKLAPGTIICKQLCVILGRRAGEANLKYSHTLIHRYVYKCVLRKMSHCTSLFRAVVKISDSKDDS